MKMRHILLLIALLFGLLPPAAAQPSEFWSSRGDRLHFRHAGISLPAKAGAVRFTETSEFSRKGEGLDTAVQYKSPDGAVWATAYVYLPGVAHAGLAALATAEGIKANSRTPVTAHPVRVVGAGGVPGVAIRSEFDGYRGDRRSSAAFVKAGRWLVKLRVTGPQDQADDVDATMTALLDGLGFEGKAKPAPATPIEAPPCPAAALPDAMQIAESNADSTENAFILGMLDPAGERPEGKQGQDSGLLLSRFGTSWCRGVADTGDAKVTFLRATGAWPPGTVGADAALVVLYSDAGGMLEVARRREGGQFVLLNHGIATTEILGMLDKVPSDAQIVRYLSGAGDDVLRTRTTITFKADGNTNVFLPAPDDAPPTT